MKTVGLDPSLTAPGLAYVYGGTLASVDTVKIPARLRDVARIDHIAAAVMTWVRGADLVVIEGPAPGSQRAGVQAGVHERAGLWWVLKREILHAGVPVAVISPSKLKKFGCGNGAAGKAMMTIAAARRFPELDFEDDNQVDAAWLAAAGAQWLGEPAVVLPKAQVAALDAGADWPELVAAA